MKNEQNLQRFELLPNLNVWGERKLITIGSIKNTEAGESYAEAVISPYPIFVCTEGSGFQLLNEHDRKALSFINHYSKASKIEVIVVRNDQAALVRVFTDLIHPFITSSKSSKDSLLEVLRNSEHLKIISSALRLKVSKKGAELPFNSKEFCSLFHKEILTYPKLNRWLKDEIKVTLPTQLDNKNSQVAIRADDPTLQIQPQVKEIKAEPSQSEAENTPTLDYDFFSPDLKTHDQNPTNHHSQETDFTASENKREEIFQQIECTPAYRENWSVHQSVPFNFDMLLDTLHSLPDRGVFRFHEAFLDLIPNTYEFDLFLDRFNKYVSETKLNRDEQ